MSGRSRITGAGEIVFPLLLYYVLNMAVPFFLSLLWPGLFSEENALWLLTVTNCCLIPVFAWMYQRDRIGEECLRPKRENRVRWKRKWGLGELLLAVLGAIFISRGVNLFLGLTFLPRMFRGYETVQAEIYGGSFLSRIAATVFCAPVLEELLMRGLVYSRIRRVFSSPKAAMLGSALIFGVFHGNVVQGVYAFCLGLFLAQVYESLDSLVPAILAHGAANGATLLAVQFPYLGQRFRGPVLYEFAAAAYLLAGSFCWRKLRESENV